MVNLVGDVCEMPMASQKCPGLTRLCLQGAGRSDHFPPAHAEGREDAGIAKILELRVATYNRVPLVSARILVVGSCGCIAAL